MCNIGYNGNIRFDVVAAHETEVGLVKKHVSTDSLLMTDTASNLRKVGRDFLFHGQVDHSKIRIFKVLKSKKRIASLEIGQSLKVKIIRQRGAESNLGIQ